MNAKPAIQVGRFVPKDMIAALKKISQDFPKEYGVVVVSCPAVCTVQI